MMTLLYRNMLNVLQAQFGSTVDVYRSPAASGGSVAALTQVGTSVPMIVVPSRTHEASGLLGALPEGLGGGQADYLGIHPGTATIKIADEIRRGTVKYKVEGTADWTLGQVCSLSLPV